MLQVRLCGTSIGRRQSWQTPGCPNPGGEQRSGTNDRVSVYKVYNGYGGCPKRFASTGSMGRGPAARWLFRDERKRCWHVALWLFECTARAHVRDWDLKGHSRPASGAQSWCAPD
jgi:hypothetical protein